MSTRHAIFFSGIDKKKKFMTDTKMQSCHKEGDHQP